LVAVVVTLNLGNNDVLCNTEARIYFKHSPFLANQVSSSQYGKESN